MDPLGDYLKQAREKKGLSLEQVALQTRIQVHHLQALETEDFANLPAKVFAKGFVRSYAKAIGLDEEEALQCFLQTSGTFYQQHQPDQPQPHVQVKLEAAPTGGVNWNLVGPVLLVIAALILWFGLQENQEPSIALSEREASSPINPIPAAPSPIEPIEEPIPPPSDTQERIVSLKPVESVPILPSPPVQEPVPAQPLPKSLAALPAEPPQPVLPTKPTENLLADESQTLEIEATQLTWVVVKSDKQDPNEALLQPGQRITWKAEKQFLVTLGNAAGVVITLNGQLQGPFGKPGQVVRDIRIQP